MRHGSLRVREEPPGHALRVGPAHVCQDVGEPSLARGPRPPDGRELQTLEVTHGAGKAEGGGLSLARGGAGRMAIDGMEGPRDAGCRIPVGAGTVGSVLLLFCKPRLQPQAAPQVGVCTGGVGAVAVPTPVQIAGPRSRHLSELAEAVLAPRRHSLRGMGCKLGRAQQEAGIMSRGAIR